MKTIDEAAALVLLKQAADQYPDFVYRENYEVCVYVQMEEKQIDGAPKGCLVGEVFNLMGISEDVNYRLTGTASSACRQLETKSWGLEDKAVPELEFSPSAMVLLTSAQAWQDGWYVTWAEAVKLAEAGIDVSGDDGENAAWHAAQELLGREFDNVNGESLDVHIKEWA